MTPQLPVEALERLEKAERRQRRETAKRGLQALPVSVLGLWLLQRGLCGCGCDTPLNPLVEWDEKSPPDDFIVIAHVLARGSRGTHDRKNVELWRHACNKRDAGPDTSGAASVKRFTPDMQRKLLASTETRDPKKWQRAGKIPQPKVSKLSREYRKSLKVYSGKT